MDKAAQDTYDLAIIGAGASGLTAAVCFLRKAREQGGAPGLILFERGNSPGRKLLVTGNGRCNLSNTAAEGYASCKEFFESLGLMTTVDEAGRVYPLNRRAASVRDALVTEAKMLGAKFRFDANVSDIKRGSGDDFVINFTMSDVAYKATATQLILAAGGKAGSVYGADGSAYRLARGMGLKVRTFSPALTALSYTEASAAELESLAGVRARAEVTLVFGGKEIAREKGEVQFTKEAISGICVFDLSLAYADRAARIGLPAGERAEDGALVRIDLVPDYSEEEVVELLAAGRAAGLSGLVHEKIAEFIERKAGGDTRAAAALLKCLEVSTGGCLGWKDAQCTYGGVSMEELDSVHFEAKSIPGLYVVGEATEYCGPCGGYNLDFAWRSGMAAGKRAGGYYNHMRKEKEKRGAYDEG